ncbi:APC family permease [Ruania zhangjianzhongii]|uniref:APC family permease n=1 Tax=Ruania zhangjianzhongii TaxID=2603206 RepID=UPI0011CA4F51|nr:APC family permease [Ruania zhangjianzhongii]
MNTLARSLTTRDAVAVGLSSMIGAGVFAAFGPAAQAVLPTGTGAALLIALALAALVAYANATSSAQLAAQYPTSGGTYLYGRERLGPWWGYLAGWGFVVGKTASCAAMALTFATYAAPPGWERPVAAAAVIALAAVNYCGVTRTARLARWIVSLVLLALAITVTVALGSGKPDWSQVGHGDGGAGLLGGPAGWYGVLQAAGLLFFAFAGYARIATMGEEVRDPQRAIPRAIVLALGGVVALYAVIAVSLLAVLGLPGIAGASAPVADAVAATPWASAVVRMGAAAASLGALLALVAGIGRTSLAMAREGDLPRGLAAVHPRFGVPHRAEVAVAIVLILLVLTVDLRGAIGFSSFGVLVYYAVANLSAWTQSGVHRRFPRVLQAVGQIGCVILCTTLPATAVLAGIVVFAVGLGLRAVRVRAG